MLGRKRTKGPQLESATGYTGHPQSRIRRRASLVAPLAIMGVVAAGLSVGATRAVPALTEFSKCQVSPAAAVVPESGVLFGVNLDWDTEPLAEHRAALGNAPAVSVQFSDIPYDRKTWAHTTNAVTQVKANGGILLLTLEPHAGLEAITTKVVDRLARDLRAVNDHGVPVVVRFAHEMNGSWYAWGQQPEHYKRVFRKVATAIHAQAPGTAMMWAPNYGGGYPFTGGQFAARPGTEDYRELDTNGDGGLSMADDPYEPYFPGDKAVDWVGISLYHWGNQRPWGNNEVPEKGKFAAMLTGTYDGTAGDDDEVPDFYDHYGRDRGHPVAIVETAAIYTPARKGASELAIKRAWWRQVFSDATHEEFPMLKMINWFEWKKYEIEINDDVDWRAAGSKKVGRAFRADLPGWLRYGNDVNSCS